MISWNLENPGRSTIPQTVSKAVFFSFSFFITYFYSYLIVIFDGTLDALDNGNGAQWDLSKYNIFFLVQEQNSWTQREMKG